MRFPESLELRTYGQQLLAGRQEKGWTQKQLSKKLFLPIHFIRALEAGEAGMLPEIPYVISMYRKVGVAVGVDPEPMIQACKAFQEREGQPPIHQYQPRVGEVVQARNAAPEPRRQSSEPPNPEAMAAPQPKRRPDRGKGDGVIVLVGGVMGLALVAAALLNNELWLAIRSRLFTPDPEAEVEEAEGETATGIQDQASETLAIQQQPIPDIPDIPDPSPVSPDGQLGEPEPGAVRLTFSADVDDGRSSWIRVENARGVLLFENIPEPFTSVDLPIAAGVRVRAGRPGLVRWQQPGQPPQSLPQSQPDGWIALIADPVVPAPREAPPLDPVSPVPAPPPEAP